MSGMEDIQRIVSLVKMSEELERLIHSGATQEAEQYWKKTQAYYLRQAQHGLEIINNKSGVKI